MNNRFQDYLEDYGPVQVYEQFLEDGGGTLRFEPLINPSMYQKALQEFTKFGRLDKFPSKYIYQWMGIIMKNTALIESATILAGHSESNPADWFGGEIEDKDYNYNRIEDDNVYVASSIESLLNDLDELYIPYEVSERCHALAKGQVKEDASQGVHRDGQMDLFMNQDQVDKYDVERERLDNARKIERIKQIVDVFNQYNNDERKFFFSYEIGEDGELYRVYDFFEFLDAQGLYDYLKLPDGSDAWSDFGIAPLFELIDEYYENDPPEKVLVLINRILDVYHQRGDLSSAFIEGGQRTLSKISGTANESRIRSSASRIIREEILRYFQLL